MSRYVVVFVVVACLASVLLAQPATVSGTLVVNKTKVVLQAGSAVGYAGASGRLVSALLSDKPANPKQFAELTRIGPGERYVPGVFEGAWKSLHIEEKALSGLTFTIDAAQKRMLTNELLVGGQNNVFTVDNDDLTLELKSAAPRLAGRIRTKQPALDLPGYKVTLDATFDLAVTEVGK